MLHKAFNNRNVADYDDFIISSRTEAEEACSNALAFFNVVSNLIFNKVRKLSNVDMIVYASINPDKIDTFYKVTPPASLTEELVRDAIRVFNESSFNSEW